MRLLYFGKFSRTYSTENYVSHALESLGVHVVKVDHHTQFPIKHVSNVKPDVVLFSKAKVRGALLLLKHCRRQNIKTVCWNWDLFFGCRSKIPPQFGAELLFTTDGGHDQHWRERAYNHRLLRQGIHAPEHQMLDACYQHDVAFVGGTGRGYHPSRNRLVKWLKETYRDRFIHHTKTRGLILNEALSQVRIVVGDSWPSPHYWSNRFYEITGRGGFLLHPHTVGLDEEWTDGQHYFGYPRGDLPQLGKIIDHFLKHADEREQIRRQGFEHCGQFTYTARCDYLIGAILSSGSQ